MSDKEYRIRYKVEPGRFTKAELKASGDGGTDAILIASVIRGEDGSTSTAFVGVDGESEAPMLPIEMFKIWVVLASQLAEVLPRGWQSNAARVAFETARAEILARRA